MKKIYTYSYILNHDKDSYLKDIFCIFFLVLVTRYLFKSHFLFYIDSVNFALGMDLFSPTNHQPQPPGYYLYILSARFANFFLSNANTALVFISILASVISAIFIYLLSRLWFDRSSAIFSSLLFLVSPLFWFHGEVAMIYLPETSLILCLAFFSWLNFEDNKYFLWIIPTLIYAILIGFRPSDALFLLPLWVVSFLKLNSREKKFSILTLTLFTVTWFIPMLKESGGFEIYINALKDLWNRVPGAQSFGLKLLLFHCLLIFTGFVFSLGLAAPLIFIKSIKISYPKHLITFLFFWIIPGLTFFTVIFFHPMTMGYALYIYAPLLIVSGAKASRWYWSSRASFYLKNVTIGTLIFFNVSLFLFSPMYFSWGQIKSVENYLIQINQDVKKSFNSQDTLLIGFDTVLYGFRQVGYYLPDFKILEYPEIYTHDGIKIFTMQHHQTTLVSAFSDHTIKNILIVCPLVCETDQSIPNKINYEVHIQSDLAKKLPLNTLKLIRKEGREYLLLEAKYLPIIFPHIF
jgi:hypothetical protein